MMNTDGTARGNQSKLFPRCGIALTVKPCRLHRALRFFMVYWFRRVYDAYRRD